MSIRKKIKLKVRELVKKDWLPWIIKILTRETVKMATFQFRVAAFIKCAPFELEGKSVFRVKMFRSKWKLAAWHGANWIYSLQTAFLLIFLAWSMWKESVGEKLVVHIFSVLGTTIGWIFMMSLYLKPKECLVMLNQYDSIVLTAKEAKLKIPHWGSHYLVILAVYYFAFALIGWWLIMEVMFLWAPTSGHYIYAYLPLTWQQNYVVILAALAYELLWSAWCVTILGTFFCYWCADWFIITDILASLLSTRMTTEAHVKIYRYLQLFCVLFNDFNGSFFTVGFTTMIVVVPIVFIYLALSVPNMNLLMYLILTTLAFFSVFLIMFFLPQHSKVGILSRDCVKILRSRSIKPEVEGCNGYRLADIMAEANRRAIFRKRTRAFAPLGIRIWYFGIYTLQTSQEMMVQLFNNILLLLSL